MRVSELERGDKFQFVTPHPKTELSADEVMKFVWMSGNDRMVEFERMKDGSRWQCQPTEQVQKVQIQQVVVPA